MSAARTSTFAVTGMHCGSCGMLIDDVVEDLTGVESSATSVRRGKTVVTYDPTRASPADIATAIASAGTYEVSLDEPNP